MEAYKKPIPSPTLGFHNPALPKPDSFTFPDRGSTRTCSGYRVRWDRFGGSWVGRATPHQTDHLFGVGKV